MEYIRRPRLPNVDIPGLIGGIPHDEFQQRVREYQSNKLHTTGDGRGEIVDEIGRLRIIRSDLEGRRKGTLAEVRWLNNNALQIAIREQVLALAYI